MYFGQFQLYNFFMPSMYEAENAPMALEDLL